MRDRMCQEKEKRRTRSVVVPPNMSYFNEKPTDLIEIKNQIELAYIAEEGIQNLHEKVNSLEIGELVVVRVDADAKEEAGVAAVDDLVVAELDRMRKNIEEMKVVQCAETRVSNAWR
ncbi:hypothetical protein BC936DRAFT_144997 [Jimgerdemannia flammicorona]|uniref:Uncharacterized protein n=1 Tax=Jimgerdemannia flammicorona TaxID=994334 RepID=A0A433DB58_9FUNG|nr:hypothetical protein BC936DRAFT_144997 [Jimgerdemannia flammicorona]